MRADLRAKTRPAFVSLRGWASPIGSGANLGLLCAVDRRAPGRGRGLGGAASDAFRKGDRLRAWAQRRRAQLVQRRAGFRAAMGFVLASRDLRPASGLAGRPAKSVKTPNLRRGPIGESRLESLSPGAVAALRPQRPNRSRFFVD